MRHNYVSEESIRDICRIYEITREQAIERIRKAAGDYGFTFTIVDELPEGPDVVVVCGPEPATPEAIEAQCEHCGEIIYFLPYQSPNSRKVCMSCAAGLYKDEEGEAGAGGWSGS